MWTDDQLDNADYVNMVNSDGGQLLNVCTIELQGSAYQGPYLMTPAPPFGSLKAGVASSVPFRGVSVATKRYSEAAVPKSIYADSIPVHQFPGLEF